MRRKVWIACGLLLAVSLVLAGCGKQITAEEIVAKMQETLDNTKDAHAIVAGSVDAEGLRTAVTVEVWEKSPDKLRAQVLEASEPDLAGSLLVSDGEQAWAYNPARNLVMIGEAAEMETPLPQEMLVSLQETIQELLNATDVKLESEEELAGQEVYKLTLTPKEGGEMDMVDGTATLWVDKKQWIVLKATFEAIGVGQGSMEVQSFDLNPGLADDLFKFEVPEGAKVVDMQAQEPVPLSLDEARALAGFPLLVPEYVPEGATLIEVFRVDDSFVLRYDHSTQVSFTVMQGPEILDSLPLGETQEMTVRGQNATVISDEVGGNTFLYWTENGVMVTVAGHIPLDEALQVAESLK
jgi:outer membrane lipoprotein-sorting protein